MFIENIGLGIETNFSSMQTNGIISQGFVFFHICKNLSLDVLAW